MAVSAVTSNPVVTSSPGTTAPPPPPPTPNAPAPAAPLPVSYAAPVVATTATAAQEAAMLNPSSHTLTLLVSSQDAQSIAAGVGPAQFRVLVNGQAVTGTISTTAQYTKGQHQTITINGVSNAQSVDIQTLGGGALYVKEIGVNGQSYQAIDAQFSHNYGGVYEPFQPGTGREAIYWQGDLHFQTSAAAPAINAANVTLSAPTTSTAPTPAPAPGQGLQLTFSSTNDAEFRILVNGQPVTGRITGTAQTALGQTQTVTVAGNFSSASTVDVQYLNALDGFYAAPVALNVQSLSINGQTLKSANAEFSRTYAGMPSFTPGTGISQLYWNGDLRFTPTPVASPTPPPPVTPPPPPPPVTPPPPPPVTGHTLTVGAGEQYATLAAAAAAAKNGDTIAIKAGTYVNQAANINANVTIESLGGPVVFTGTQNISNRKAYLVVNGNVTVDGITFQNAQVSSTDGGNGAGIRFESGNLTVKNSTFLNNQEGILTTGNPAATLTVDSSTFIGNGSGSGYTHAIYAGTIASLTVTNSNFEGTNVGHDVKSRAARSTITGNTFDDNKTASYSIDLPNATNAVIANNVFAKAATAGNSPAIHFGGEVPGAGSLQIQNDVFLNQKAGGVVVYNNQPNGSVTLTGNYIYGESAVSKGSPVTQSGNMIAPKLPTAVPLPRGYTQAGSTVFANLLSTFHVAA